MKVLVIASILTLTSSSFAVDLGYLKPSDQTYYKNDSFEGQNKMERIDSLVKELNKVYGEMASMKADIAQLKQDVEALKAKK